MRTYTDNELIKMKDVYYKLNKTLEGKGREYYEKCLQGKTIDELTDRQRHLLEMITEGIYKRAYLKRILNENGILVM